MSRAETGSKAPVEDDPKFIANVLLGPAYARSSRPTHTVIYRFFCCRDAKWSTGVHKSRIGFVAGKPKHAALGKPTAVSWERIMQRKLGPRVAGLTQVMDPLRCVLWCGAHEIGAHGDTLVGSQVTEQAVDRNLLSGVQALTHPAQA